MTTKDTAEKAAKQADKALAQYGDEMAEGAAKLASKGTLGRIFSRIAKPLCSGVKLCGKRIPVVGAVVTGGFALYEVGENALKGEFGRAGTALVAGAAETAGNVIGFGVGDLAREAVRQPVSMALGDKWTPEESGLLTLGKSIVGASKPDAPKV